jgi:hypothetical protein
MEENPSYGALAACHTIVLISEQGEQPSVPEIAVICALGFVLLR